MFNTKAQKAIKAEYLAALEDDDKNYHNKRTEVVVKLSTGEYVPLERLSIRTQFWYGEGIYRSMEDALSLAEQVMNNERTFINSNLAQIDRLIKRTMKYLHIVNAGVYVHPYYSRGSEKVLSYTEYNDWEDKYYYGDRKLSDDDAMLIVKGLWYQRRLFQKRIKTYLKRYGLSKVTANTFWADR